MNKRSHHIRNSLAKLLPESSREFSTNIDHKNQQLKVAKDAFLEGYHVTLMTPENELPGLFTRVPWYKLGFFLEGAGMALTLHDNLSSKDDLLGSLIKYANPIEQKFCAIGVGWASARLKKNLQWSPERLNQIYQGDLINGYGFHEGLFRSFRVNKKNLLNNNNKISEHYYIGKGRALWFLYDANIPKVSLSISKNDREKQTSVWKGIGIACAFNQNEKKIPQLTQSAGSFSEYLISGIEVGKYLLYEIYQSTKIKNYG